MYRTLQARCGTFTLFSHTSPLLNNTQKTFTAAFQTHHPKKEWKRYGSYVDYACRVSFFGNWFIHSIGFIPVNLWKLR